MTLREILEAGMLFCFGFAWPFNIYRSYKARANVGKSLLFLIVIWMGYLLGIFYKASSPTPDFVLWIYVLNIVMVSTDIALFYRNHLISKSLKESSDK
jgi:hypothetical protein